jgi:uncharacterized protein YjbI with pentapeptide repeats
MNNDKVLSPATDETQTEDPPPRESGDSTGFDHLKEALKNASKLYYLFFGFLTFCVLTVASTSDRHMIDNPSVKIPFVESQLPLHGFFILGPMLAIALFVYLQFYLVKIKEGVNQNGNPAMMRTLYPWMPGGTPTWDNRFINSLQKLVVNLSFWWSLPIVLTLFALWIIRKQDIWASCAVGGLSLFAVYISYYFWKAYDPPSFNAKACYFSVIIITQGLILWGILCSGLVPAWLPEPTEKVPLLVNRMLRRLVTVDLSSQSLVTQPESEHESLYWANLQGIRLQSGRLSSTSLHRADLSDANLIKANLSEADLIGAKLVRAHLSQAELYKAKLTEANLAEANLEKANLNHADLTQAHLVDANLKGANLVHAVLSGTWLSNSDLTGADLRLADFQNAVLIGADLSETDITNAIRLTLEQILLVKSLHGAKLDETLAAAVRKTNPSLLHSPGDQ